MKLGFRAVIAVGAITAAVAASLCVAIPAVNAAVAASTPIPDSNGVAAPADLSKTGTSSLGASSVRWIGAPTTGMPDGQALTVYTGDLTITQAGTVINGMDIRGFVFVQAPNVTIKNSIIRGRAISTNIGLVMANNPAATNLVIQDSEIYAANPSPYVSGVMGGNFTLIRDNIHDVVDQVHIFGNNVTVQDSWLHGNLHYANDPNQNNGPTHDDSVQIQSGDNIKLTGNYMTGAHNSALMVTQAQGPVTNLTVSGNFLDYGACTINVTNGGGAIPTSIFVTNNIFGNRSTYSRCAVITATMAFDLHLSGNTFVDGTAIVQRPYS